MHCFYYWPLFRKFFASDIRKVNANKVGGGRERSKSGSGRKGQKKFGRWENGGEKLWEVGDRGQKVGGGKEGKKMWEVGNLNSVTKKMLINL